MPRQKAANLVKGCAWLFLAASTLPTFSTQGEPTTEVTELAVGLPWSPWLMYRESWSTSGSMQAGGPVVRFETNIEPCSGSTATMCVGLILLAVSRLLKASDKKCEPRPAPRTFKTASALGAQ